MKSIWPISIRYEGKPQGKERPRFGKGKVYTPQGTREYEIGLGWIAKKAMMGRKPIEGAVSLSLNAYFKGDKPRGDAEYILKPDIDNILKAVADSLNGIVYLDDAQITSLSMRKVYGDQDAVDIIVGPF